MKLIAPVLLCILLVSCANEESFNQELHDSLKDTTGLAGKADTGWYDMDTMLSNAQYIMYAIIESNSAMKAHSWLRCLSDDSVHCWEGDMGMSFGYHTANGDTLMNGHWPVKGDTVLAVTYPKRSFSDTPLIALFAYRDSSYYRFWSPYNIDYRPVYFRLSANTLPVGDFADGIVVHNGAKYCPDGCLYPLADIKLKEQ